MQDAGQVCAVLIKARQPLSSGGRRQQGVGNGRVTITQALQLLDIAAVLPLGQQHQIEQHIGDAFAGRQHHAQLRRWLRL